MGFFIGKKTDFTVLMLLEKWQPYGYDGFTGKNKIGKPFYKLVYMDRLPLDTPHPVQVEHVSKTMKRIKEIYNRAATLVIDVGSVGETHFDAYKEKGLNVRGGGLNPRKISR